MARNAAPLMWKFVLLGEDVGWWGVEGGVRSARVLASAASQFWVNVSGDILTWLSEWGGKVFVCACGEGM